MKIVKWKGNPLSAVNGIAYIQVNPDEVADIEEMVKLTDGDSVGNFGFSVKLHSSEAPDKGGFPRTSVLKSYTRIYECFVHRD